MKRKKFFTTILSLLLVSIINAQTFDNNHKINIDNYYEYLPEYLAGINLGISFKDFTTLKDTTFLNKIDSGILETFAFQEDINDGYLDKIIYIFDSTPDSLNNTLPLFQINIFYTEEEQANNFTSQKFGEPLISNESFSQWILKTNKNFVLIVKQSLNEIKFIATIAGAEWDINK